MGGAVLADHPRPVDGEQHGQVLDGHVVNRLVVGALQEGRVNRDHGAASARGQARGESDGMLLGDADVEVAVGKLLRKANQPRALAHGGGDGDQFGVASRGRASPAPEHLRVARFFGVGGGGRQRRLGGVEFADRMETHGVVFRRQIAFALDGLDVHELGLGVAESLAQHVDQGDRVVPVDGPDVLQAQVGEGGKKGGGVEARFAQPRLDKALQSRFEALGRLVGARDRQAFDHVLGLALQDPRHVLRGVGQQPGQGADVGRDRHLVVVEQDDERRPLGGVDVVERLVGHARRHRAVADDGQAFGFAPQNPVRSGHAQGGPDGRRGMADAEGVVGGFGDFGEGGQAPARADGADAVFAAREDLVGVGLMPHIPHDVVARRVQDVMRGHGDFHRPQVARHVPAAMAQPRHDGLPHLFAKLRQGAWGQAP